MLRSFASCSRIIGVVLAISSYSSANASEWDKIAEVSTSEQSDFLDDSPTHGTDCVDSHPVGFIPQGTPAYMKNDRGSWYRSSRVTAGDFEFMVKTRFTTSNGLHLVAVSFGTNGCIIKVFLESDLIFY